MGGKSAPAPDYSGMEAVANRQLDFSQKQYNDMQPILTGLAQTAQASQEQQMAQAQDYFKYQQETFRPLEQGIVKQAQEFSTQGYQQQQASQAASDAARAFGQTQSASQRAMAARGINPNSGAGMAMSTQGNLGLAAMKAGAMTGARNQAQQTGFAMQTAAAGLGRNLAGSSTAAYAGANQAGSLAGTQFQQPGSSYQTGLGQAGQTFGNMANTQANVYNSTNQANAEIFGALAGAGIAKFSDRRMKHKIEEVGRDERTMLPLYEFEYKGSTGKRYLGVMADDVERKYPDMVITMPNGFKAVNYAGLGIEMVEV